jgi:hypothetical protein
MKINRYGLGLSLGTLLLSQAITITTTNPAQALTSSPYSPQIALNQEQPIYVTDRQFTKGEWSFRVNQAGSDLEYQGSSLIRGKDITVNQVKRTKERDRLIYTWRTAKSTFYVVSWKESDPTFARLRIIKSGRVVVNELAEEQQ